MLRGCDAVEELRVFLTFVIRKGSHGNFTYSTALLLLSASMLSNSASHTEW